MTPEELWTCLSELKGLPLKTLERRNPFIVSEVTYNRLFVRLLPEGKPRSVPRWAFTQTFEKLLTSYEMTAKSVINLVGEQYATYVVSLLASVPNVAVIRKPIRLIYNGLQLFYLPISRNQSD